MHRVLAMLLVLSSALPAPARAQIAEERPLAIEVTADLEFSRLALTGAQEGSVTIDAQTGARRVGEGLVPLGGMVIQGHGRITGTPLRAVRIDLPGRIAMSTGTGGTAELSDFATDLPAFPMLDASGTLEFRFGGRLRVTSGSGGTFRGRIPISVDYN